VRTLISPLDQRDHTSQRGCAHRSLTSRSHRNRWPLCVATTVLWSALLQRGHTQAQEPLQRDEHVSRPTSAGYEQVLDRAVEAFEAKDYARSRALFEQAFALRPNARVLRGLGISALHLEHYATAKRELTDALRDSRQPLTAAQRENVIGLLAWLQSHSGTLRLQVRPKDAHVVVDDEPLNESTLILAPGKHRVVVASDGYSAQSHSVDIAAAQEEKLEITLSPDYAQLERKPAVSAAEVASAAVVAEHITPSPLQVGPSVQSQRDRDSSSVFEQWWFWTAVGLVVAGGVATTVAVTSTPPKSYARGGLGGVLKPLELAP
jgi:hypothetical protein